MSIDGSSEEEAAKELEKIDSEAASGGSLDDLLGGGENE